MSMFEQENNAVIQIEDMISDYLPAIRALWHWGDGDGGYILNEMRQEVGMTQEGKSKKNTKKKIGHKLRIFVFERDMYRCVACDSHLDLTVDHIHPESAGGETVEDNLQTLCRSCNSKKGTRVTQ